MAVAPPFERQVALAFVARERLVDLVDQRDAQFGAAQDGTGPSGGVAGDPVAPDTGERLLIGDELGDERCRRSLLAREHEVEELVGEFGVVAELLHRGRLGVGRSFGSCGAVGLPQLSGGGSVDGGIGAELHTGSLAAERDRLANPEFLVCALRMRKGGSMHYAGKVGAEEFWALIDDSEAEIRRGLHERPAYTVSGWRGSAMVSEWSYGSSGIRSVICLPEGWAGIETTGQAISPRIEVLVDDVEPRAFVARRQAFEAFAAGGEPALPAIETEPPVSVIELAVDGVAEPFEVWADGEQALAAGRIAAVTVLVVAVGWPVTDVALERIHDIQPFLDPRRRWIRTVRGEE